MSRSINKVTLLGYVGSDPEVRDVGSKGNRVANVSLATSRAWKNGQQEKTEWHRLTFWGSLADLVSEYVHKGDRIYVEGSLEYQEREAGGQYANIVVRELVMLGASQREQPAMAAAKQGRPATSTRSTTPSSPFEPSDEDDLPF